MSVPFKTTLIDLTIGSLSVSLEVVTNIDELFNELASRNADDPEVKDERIPYWAELWPSSLVMAEYLEKNQHIVKSKKIIELGCGLGLSGIVAGMLGGKVLMTDYQQSALDFAAKNWSRNVGQINCSTHLLDWRQPDLQEKFDLILAADVAYESKVFPHLIRTFKKMVAPNGTILITEPNRKFARDFIEQLRKTDFEVESYTTEKEFRGTKNTIHLHSLRLK